MNAERRHGGSREDAEETSSEGPRAEALRLLNDRDFHVLQRYVHQEAGIFLGPHKKALLVARLGRRLRELGLSSFGDYYRQVLADETGEERVRMLDSICTNETSFFREPGQFKFLERQVIPFWEKEAAAGRRPRRVTVWSAACSTGEEPYSLAMSLLFHLPVSAGWTVEVLASDLSTRALRRARRGIWPIEKAAAIPERYLKRFMLKGTRAQEGRTSAGSELRASVRFLHFNLIHPSSPSGEGFDLVFCRNVLIYFNPETRRQVVQRLVELVAPGGLLFLGHAEGLTGLARGVRSVFPNVYEKTASMEGRPW